MISKTGAELLAEIADYRARTGMSATAFGVQAMNAPNFLTTLRRTRQPRQSTVDQVRAFIATHPNGLPEPRRLMMMVPARLHARLAPHADRRGIAVAELAERLIAAVVQDGIVDAVLDDG